MTVAPLSEEDERIVNDIVDVIVQEMQNYLSVDNVKRRKTLADEFKGIADYPKRQGLTVLPMTLQSKDNTKSMTPEDMRNEVINQIKNRIDNQNNNSFREDTFSKVLSESEKSDILQNTRGKLNIKKEFPDQFPRGRPEIEYTKEKREGFPIVYSTTTKVNDIKRLLNNEVAANKIRNDLCNYANNLSTRFFKSVVEDIFDIIVSEQGVNLNQVFSSFNTNTDSAICLERNYGNHLD